MIFEEVPRFHEFPGSRVLVPEVPRFSVLSSRFSVLGSWFLVLGSRFAVLGLGAQSVLFAAQT